MTTQQFKKMKKKGKIIQSEADQQDQFCAYLKLKYPHLLFRVDQGGSKLTIGQAMRFKRQQKSRGWPDIFLAEARGGFFGLFIEGKTEDTLIYKKDGDFSTEHLREQHERLWELEKAGYAAYFGKGFDGCRRLVDEYMALPLTNIAGF